MARGVVSTGAGVVAGGAVTAACEGGTLGLGTPVCVVGGIAAGGVASWATGKGFDAAASVVGKLF
jgi:hypothetical protein